MQKRYRPLAVGAIIALCAGSALGLTRVPNTTIDVPLEPQSGTYGLEDAFGSLTFPDFPVGLVTPPGETNRLFVVERRGRISVISDLDTPTRTVFLDLTDRVSAGGYAYNEDGLLGLAFHPNYASNGYFYVFYTGDATTTDGTGRHDILSRFEMISGNPNAGDASSELRLLVQYDEASNHNAGDLHFGPDGYLYVSLGDEGGANDQWNNSQKIDEDFFAGIIRIDVDHRPGSLTPNSHPAATTNYAIPPDNPFIGVTNFNGDAVNTNNVRTEFWAVGLRNPWRMRFDPYTGILYAADVGQNAWEELNIIEKGGNYGWAFREGFVNGPKSGSAPARFEDVKPLLAYPRGANTYEGRAIVGGVVYRGTELPEFYGAYIFGDFGYSYSTDNDSKMWMLRHEGTNVTEWVYLDRLTGLGAIGVDPRNGDVLAVPVETGVIQRLVRTAASGSPPPATLSATGVYSDTANLTPSAGLVPYDINLPFWSDHAIKSRWFSIPDTNDVMAFSADGHWDFPTGSVWVKHFELELNNGVPASRKRIETRLLVKNEDGVFGFTYRWGDATNDAVLVDAEGLDETFFIEEGGSTREQVWRYPSRSECLACHTSAGGLALGFNTPQLNRESDMGGGNEQQLLALSAAGYFSNTVSEVHILPRMEALDDETISLEHRVRGYLAANCAQCHSPGPGLWDGAFAARTAEAGLVNGALVNNMGDASNRVFSAGSLDLSMALQRISVRGPSQMPPLGSNVIDTQAVALVSAWVTNSLPAYQTFAEWQVDEFGATNAVGAGPDEDFDADGDSAYLEFLNRTDPKSAASFWAIQGSSAGTNFTLTFNRAADRGYTVEGKNDLAAADWTPLNSPSNAPTFTSSNTIWTISDPTTESNRFYRVRAVER